jgi:hypothetical protein
MLSITHSIFEHSGSEQAAMAAKPKPNQNAVDFTYFAEEGQDMENIRARMREETLAPSKHVIWQTAATHQPRRRVAANKE